MEFVMSYSCGKDSTLALHKMISAGHKPLALLVMADVASDRSFFHGADYSMLEEYSASLGLPLVLTPSRGEDYHLAMEASLEKAKEMGAAAACFGDIDIESNRAWSTQRCKNVGLEARFPLWHRDRAENVYDLIALGYKCLIKSVNNTLLPKDLLGRILDAGTVEIMRNCGIDICGENGEYHTLAMDGPIFKDPMPFKTGRILDFGQRSVIEVNL